MAAKHLEIAREDGPKAGFNAWIEQMERSGLPQVKKRLKEVRAQGNKKAQFDFYCAEYGKQIFKERPATAVTPEVVAEAAAQPDAYALLAVLAKQMGVELPAQTQTPVTPDEDDSLDDVDEDEAREQYTRSGNPGRKQTPAPANGEDDAFKPRDPDALATAGRLWRLNEAGLLKIVSKPVDPITNGDAHPILKAILG